MAEFRKYFEGLQTRLGDRGPGSVAASTGKLAADVALDFVPGAGLVKSGAEFLWDVLGNRRQRVNFKQLDQRASMHKQALKQAGVDPNIIFHIDDEFAKILSDEALYKIMSDTLDYLDKDANSGYNRMKTTTSFNLVEQVAYNYVKEHIDKISALKQTATKEGEEPDWQIINGRRMMKTKDGWILDDQKGGIWAHKDGQWKLVAKST
jgi:hypothetical protein